MTTELKGKGIEEILEERQRIAEKGSCKTCQYLLKVEDEDSGDPDVAWEWECGIQGNWEPICFSQALLDSKPYPAPCDQGSWRNIDDEGHTTDIPVCLAYNPRVIINVSYGDATVSRQWKYMEDLAGAAKLNGQIDDVKSGKAEEKLATLLAQLQQEDTTNIKHS